MQHQIYLKVNSSESPSERSEGDFLFVLEISSKENFGGQLWLILNAVIIPLITHLERPAMTLQTQRTLNTPAILTDVQRRRVSDALENTQSVNTRRNYHPGV